METIITKPTKAKKPRKNARSKTMPQTQPFVSQQSTPQQSLPQQSTPQPSIPQKQVAIPQQLTPQQVMPQQSTPQQSIPQKQVPIPQQSTTQQVVPQVPPQGITQQVPPQGITQQLILQQATTQQSVPQQSATVISMQILQAELKRKGDMKQIKDKLKKKKSFQEGLDNLIDFMKKNPIGENKRMVYEALNIISYRLGKPGFDSSSAKKVFDLALANIDCFTPGYAKNIRNWASSLDDLISGRSVDRSDGRFNTEKESRNPPRLDMLNTYLLLSHMLALPGMDYGASSDEEEDPYDSYERPSIFHSALREESPHDIAPSVPFFTYRKDLSKEFRTLHGEKENSADFTISPEDFTEIMNSSKSKVVLVCVNPSKTSVPFPEQVQIEVNKKGLSKDTMANRKASGLELSKEFLVKGLNSVKIITSECICTFRFVVKISEENSVEDLMKPLVEKKLDHDECLKKVIASFKSDDDVEQLSIPVSLKDPLSQCRIQIPARGRKCLHFQCFDLQTYLLFNEHKPSFSCPCCSKSTRYEDLVVDSYFMKLLEAAKSNENTQDAEIMPDGTFKVLAEKKRKYQQDNERKAKIPKLEESTGELTSSTEPLPMESEEKKVGTVIDLTD